MKIDDDHKFHGAALMQIAEDPHFTAINPIKIDGQVSRSAFRINDDIGVFLKYATKPVGAYSEYMFTFTQENLEHLNKLKEKTNRVFLALVCVKGREICCLSYEQLMELINLRRQNQKPWWPDKSYVILVTLPLGKSFRVYINFPGTKGTHLGKKIIISRSGFPKRLF